MLNNLNSDELRQRLNGNTLKMNLLTAENDLIVDLLSKRGLQAVSTPDEEHHAEADHPFAAFLKRISEKIETQKAATPVTHEMDHCSPKLDVEPELDSSEKKPLTTDELRAGGWFIAGWDNENELALMCYGIGIMEWHIGNGDHKRIVYDPSVRLCRRVQHNALYSDKEIHCVGSLFYWGAP